MAARISLRGLRAQRFNRLATDGRASNDIPRNDASGQPSRCPRWLCLWREVLFRERTIRQRKHIGSLLQGICLLVGVEIALSPATAVAQSNPIVIENQQPGSGDWWWTKLADDVNQQIKG